MSCRCGKSNCGCATQVVSGCCGETNVLVAPLDGFNLIPDPVAQLQSCLEVAPVSDEIYPVHLKANVAFNMPACGQTADISVSKANRYAAGQVLFNGTIGYLLVMSVVDAVTVRVKNECLACNVKSPGETIEAGTIFAIGIPQCGVVGGSPTSSTQPFLDSDFVVPAIGEPGVTVKVTNVAGLSINDTISVASLTYKVAAIIDSTTIRLVNMGNGGVLNTLVESDENGDEVPDYPIIRIGGQNPCATAVVHTVDRLIGCAGSIESGLVGEVTGQVPSWDNIALEWQLKVVSDLALCVTIATCCLTLDPDNPDGHSYIIDVNPGTEQIAAELAKVSPNPLGASINGDAFCITAVIDANTIRVRPAFDVVTVQTYEAGAVVCVQACCEQCRPTVETPARFGLGNGAPEEILVVIAPVSVSAPPGTSVWTFPASIGTAGQGNLEADESLWDLTYTNEGGCGCRKYFRVKSNFEFAVSYATAGVFANLEYRLVKVLPTANSISYAAQPFVSNRGNLAALDNGVNLLRGGNPGTFNIINTWKGFVEDRDFLNASEQALYKGHVRLVVENTTGGAVDVYLGGSMRVWYESASFKDGTP